jgi:hypothetical protein
MHLPLGSHAVNEGVFQRMSSRTNETAPTRYAVGGRHAEGDTILGRYEHGTLTEQTILPRPAESKGKNKKSTAGGVTLEGSAGSVTLLRPIPLVLLVRFCPDICP